MQDRSKFQRKEKQCIVCNSSYIPTGQNQKTCSTACTQQRVRDKTPLYTFTYLLKKGTSLIGVGSGGRCGKSNSNFKHNIAFFHRIGKILKQENQSCERCGKDIYNATKGNWALHHKDHNRKNNEIHNLELLCKRCHQIEHDCWKAFESVTTISQESSCKCSEAPNTAK